MDDKIEAIYTDVKSPGGFSGFDRLYTAVKEKHPEITKKQVREFLQGSRTYGLYKPRRVNYPRSKIVPAGFLSDVHVDLGDFQSLAKENRGYRFLLVAVDLLSKRLFSAPVRSKHAKDMITAFDQIFRDMPYLPQKIFSDRGGEFESKEMLKYFESLGIQKFQARASHIKAATAERFLKSVKERLYRFFSEKNTVFWLDAVPKITDALNHSVSTVTGRRPVDIDEKNANEVWEEIYRKELYVKNKKLKFANGDFVRLTRFKKIFEKGYYPTFTDEIFIVKSSAEGNPNYYELEDLKGGAIEGRVYEPEMTKVRMDERTTHRVESVIKKRTRKGKKEVLVKFIGYPDPEWILEKDLIV